MIIINGHTYHFYSTYSNKYTSQIKLKFNVIHIHMLWKNKFDIKLAKSYEILTISQTENIIHILTKN